MHTIPPIIALEQVRVQFGSFIVHDSITLSVNVGETVTILGPSGTGKTIILKLIIGLLFPNSGQVRVMGHELRRMSERELHELRKSIGMLFQGAALFDSLTVFENVAYSLRELGHYSEEELSSIVHEKLEVVGLSDIDAKLPAQLSGGQKKRVGLARALASSPRIVLFDEPTTGLDPTARRLIDDLIIKLKVKYGITSVVVTHDIESARKVSDRWIMVSNGEVLADGPVELLARQSAPVIDFISGKWSE